MGDILGRELDLDEVVFLDLDASGGEGELVAGDDDLADLPPAAGGPLAQNAAAPTTTTASADTTFPGLRVMIPPEGDKPLY